MNEPRKCKKCQSDIPSDPDHINCSQCPSFINRFGLIFFLLAVVFIIFTAVSSGNDKNKRDKKNSRPQESYLQTAQDSVYKEISLITNCQELQERFNLAEVHGDRNRSNGNLELARISTGYMKAIDKQMGEVGCY